MKKLIVFTVIALAGAFCIGCVSPSSVANAADVYELFGEDFIKMYEEDIAKRQVVSQLTDDELLPQAKEYGISVEKLRKALILQDAFRMAGNDYSVKQLLEMKTGDIIKNTRALFKHLKRTLPAEEYKRLDAKFKVMLQKAIKKK